MRILTCHPAADYATGDLHRGLVGALRRAGHHVDVYALGHRITIAGIALKTMWRWQKKAGGPLADVKPSPGDIVHEASTNLVYQFFRGPNDGSGPYDACLIVTGMYLHPDCVVVLRRAGVPLGLLLSESPYDTQKEFRVAKYADVCWTNERSSVQVLRYANPNTHYLPHAFDPEKHFPDVIPPPPPDQLEANFARMWRESEAPMDRRKMATDPLTAIQEQKLPSWDVVFVGTGFEERIEILEAVDWDGIAFGLYGSWGLLGSRHRLRRHVQGGVITNLGATALYRRAKIGLNLYRTSMGFGKGVPHVSGAESLNPRALELAACGVFTISNYRAEVEEVFGDLVPTFREPGELGPLIRRWLADDEGRAQVAAQLPARVADRTFDAMAAQVAGDLERVTAPQAQMQEAAG